MDKPLNTTGILLCTCRGKISKHIDLEALSASFKDRTGQVIITDSLCEDWTPLENMAKQARIASLVLGACSEEPFLSKLPEKLGSAGLDEFSSSTLDLLGYATLGLDKLSIYGIATLLLEGLLEKAKRYPGAAPENLKPYWFRGGEKISRRQLFSAPRLRYELVPTVEVQKCSFWKGCSLCFPACPVDALAQEEGKVSIKKELCTGCGACATVCPSDAILYPGFTLLELEAQLESLIGDKKPGTDHRVIAFICSPSRGIFQEALKKNGSLARSIMPVMLPCLALASPYLIMKTLSLGAASVIMLSCKTGCPKGIQPEKISSNVHMAQAIASASGGLAVGETVVYHLPQDSKANMSGEIDAIARTAKTDRLFVPGQVGNGNSRGRIGAVLSLYAAKMDKRGTSDLAGARVPLGKVEIDSDKCTMCELCAAHCPTGALKLEQAGGDTKILFSYSECVACNICLKSCPERKKGAIKVEKAIDWQSLKNSPVMLVESKQICCSKCGTPIGNSLMIDKIRNKMGPGATTAFDLCSQCRFKAALFRESSLNK